MRTDLPLGPLGAQLLHAGGESSPGDLPEGTIAVVLGVPDEAALEAVSARLALAGTRHVRVVENDAPYTGQLMSIGVVPGEKGVVGRALRGLQTLR